MDENKLLSELTIYSKYSKYNPLLSRRELWNEIVERYLEMMVQKYPHLTSQIREGGGFIKGKKILPSMRALQFAGPAITKNNTRIYNCSYLPIDHQAAFQECMFLLLSGCGVGISVQKRHVKKLPIIRKPLVEQKFLVSDCIEGWADAVKTLMKAYLSGGPEPRFDFSDIRDKGTPLVTSGGKAPGPAPLKECLDKIKQILSSKEDGTKLSTIEVYDIVCHIADAVLAGGIRRAALITLFSLDDELMLNSKTGNWWETNPQRARSNNSAAILRGVITKDQFNHLWSLIRNSGCGEPGFVLTNDLDYGCNPCGEISLRNFQFCNLTEINASTISCQTDFNRRAHWASFFGTLQAGFLDLHYLRPIWIENTQRDGLIGVGMTGICDGEVQKYSVSQAAKYTIEVNKQIAKSIGINPAARTTTIKPSGTTSLVLGTSSGIHSRYGSFYVRRMRFKENEPIVKYLMDYMPELLEYDEYSPGTVILSIPQKSPENAIFRNENILNQLERIKRFNQDWVHSGYVSGPNNNNVSATVFVKEDEWDIVRDWMWENKQFYGGITVLPYDGGTYKQAPFEEITEEKYLDLKLKLTEIDFTSIIEDKDYTSQKQELACVGGVCEIGN